ncbi:MAG: hypothetical protein ACAI35_09065 [Candidatus Methylacidiphilales bacterium]
MRNQPQARRSSVTIQALSLIAGFVGLVQMSAILKPSACSTPNTPYPTRYMVIDLGTDFEPSGLNDHGVVVANSSNGPKVWVQGTSSSLSTAIAYEVGPQVSYSTVGVDNAGHIAGVISYLGSPTNGPMPNMAAGVYWASATDPIQPIGTHPGAGYKWVYAISSEGFIVGDLSGDAAVKFGVGPAFTDVDGNNTTQPLLSDNGHGLGEGMTAWGASGTNNWCGRGADYDAWEFGPVVNGHIYSDPGIADALFVSLNESRYVVGQNGTNAALFVPMGSTYAVTNLGPGRAIGINNQTFTDTNNVTSPSPQIIGYSQYSPYDLFVCDKTSYDGSRSNDYVTKRIDSLLHQPPNGIWHVTSMAGINEGGAIAATATFTSLTNGRPSGPPVRHGVLLVPVTLDEVNFYSTESSPKGQFNVCQDLTGTNFAVIHGSNQWQAPNVSSTNTFKQTGWQDAVCFSSGSKMTVAVQLKVAPGSNMWSSFTNMKIKGIGVTNLGKPDDSAGYDFINTDGKGFSASYSSTANAITATGIVCNKAFPTSTVGYINPLTILWYYSIDGGTNWSLINTSKNELFITLTAPNLSPTVVTGPDANYKLFQTVLYYACSNPGATTSDAAVANTWSLFTSGGTGPANITAWNPTDKKYSKKLYYYARDFNGLQPVSTRELLGAADGNGECPSFGQLFQDALWANGVDSTGIRITSINGDSFLVKDFTASVTGSMPSSEAPYLWKMTFSTNTGEMQPPPSTNTIHGTYGDFINLATLRGQNTAPPLEKVFGNHYIVQYKTGYYDPSYGTTYASPNDFEITSVQGYARDIVGDSLNYKVRPASGLHNIQFSTNTYLHQ